MISRKQLKEKLKRIRNKYAAKRAELDKQAAAIRESTNKGVEEHKKEYHKKLVEVRKHARKHGKAATRKKILHEASHASKRIKSAREHRTAFVGGLLHTVGIGLHPAKEIGLGMLVTDSIEKAVEMAYLKYLRSMRDSRDRKLKQIAEQKKKLAIDEKRECIELIEEYKKH